MVQVAGPGELAVSLQLVSSPHLAYSSSSVSDEELGMPIAQIGFSQPSDPNQEFLD